MATVFFGEKTFDDYIQNQIKTRQQATGRELGENILLGYFAKTCWVSLTSFVDITSEKLRNNLNTTESPSELSTKIILRNGVTSLKDNKTTSIQGGIGPDKTYGNKFLSTNSKLKYPLGLKPIPGITSVNIKSKGTYGSLLEAEINFMCHDIVQLEKLEPLFMRPGYSVLLEWGWSQYINNEQKINETVGILNTSKNTSTQKSVQDFISKQRKDTYGNRDGMVGLVKNFTWSLKKDGGYDCKLTLISTGAATEGIPIDADSYGFVTKNDLTKRDLLLIPLSRIGTVDGKEQVDETADQLKDQTLGLTELKSKSPMSLMHAFCLFFIITPYEGGEIDDILSEKSAELFNTEILEKFIKPYLTFNRFTIKLPAPKDNPDATTVDRPEITYIRFKEFIEFINKFFSIKDKDDKEIIKFELPTRVKADYNQFSTDVKTCLIINQGFLDYNGIEQLKKNKFGPENSLIKNDTLLKYPWVSPINSTNEELSQEYYGNLKNVFISVNCIYNAYVNNKTSLLNFIQAILDDINRSIGSINSFSTLIDPDDSSLARIIDINYVEPSKNQDEKSIFGLKEEEFEIFNNKCILTNIQISSEIPNSMQTSIAIGASQGSSNDVSENTNPYNAFSLGITDRLLKDRYVGTPIDPNKEIENYKRQLEVLSQCFLWSDDYFSIAQGNSELESSLRNYINWVRKNTIYPTEAGGAIIPLKLSFEIEGISGIQIGQRFGIPSRILPSSYRASDGTPKVGFIVTEMSHKIDNNRWITKVSALMYVLESKVLLDMQRDPEAAKPFLTKLNLLEVSSNLVGNTITGITSLFSGTAGELIDYARSITSERLFNVYLDWYLASETNAITQGIIDDRKGEIESAKVIAYAQSQGVSSSITLSKPPFTNKFTGNTFITDGQKLSAILYLKNNKVTEEERNIILKEYEIDQTLIDKYADASDKYILIEIVGIESAGDVL